MRVLCSSCGRSYVVGSGQERTVFTCTCGAAIDPTEAAEVLQGQVEGGEPVSAAGGAWAPVPDGPESDWAARAEGATGAEVTPPSRLLIGLLYVLSFCMILIGPIWAVVWASGRESERRRHGRNALILFGIMLAVWLGLALLIVSGGSHGAGGR